VTDETEYERWLPVEQAISDVDAVAGMLERRIFARILQDAGELPPLPDGEPFATVLTHSGAAPASEPDGRDLGDLDNAVDLDRSIAQAGSDAVRLALLYSASRTSVLRFSDEHLHYCQRFLQRLYSYAEPRLREFEWLLERTTEPAQMDSSDRLRRHLAHWCAVACEKTTAALEGLELQRAVHNVIRLLTRIEDFERRVSEQRAESDALDEQAIVAALLVLVRLIAPLAPHIAEELWSVAGSTVCVSDSSWPTHRRPRRLAVER
jgi:leucyl-tRNA synthetase